jgi:N-acetylglutamate synthase-like GNAT family acetyltransferase
LDLGIECIDNNESTFCSLWSRLHKKIECVELFSNPKLGDDYFFNRLNINNWCNNVDDILNFIKTNYNYNLNRYYIHLICNNENSARLNKPKFGTMKILSLDVNKYVINSTKHIEVDIIDRNSLNMWIDVFCRSFDSLSIIDEVTTIISNQFKKFTLFVAHYYLNQIKYPVGCCLLFEKNECIGLYCLGTTHDFRRKGVARELISNAVKMAKNNDYNSIIVQTLTKERYEEFYKRLGFRTIYKKMLYTFYLN